MAKLGENYQIKTNMILLTLGARTWVALFTAHLGSEPVERDYKQDY